MAASHGKGNIMMNIRIMILMMVVMACMGGSMAGGAPATVSGKVDGREPITVHYYERIAPDGERRVKVEPPTTISNHDLILFKDDRSCGSAALATVLRYTFNKDVNEVDIIRGMLTYGDRESIGKRNAFSFYDMKCYLTAIGHSGTGYKIDGRISYEQFRNDDFGSIGNKTLIPVDINGYAHFTVYRSFDEHYVYLGSPFYGNICMTFEDLNQSIVQKSIFVVRKH